MARKTRTSSTSVRPVYDDFEPSTEFSENHEAHFLRILLPGFRRDQMKITFMNFTRMLDVSGERQIDSENENWVRFNQSYPIPQNCEAGKLQANFNQGVLTIAMPKKILSQHSPTTEAQQKSPFPTMKNEPRPDNKAQLNIPQKAQEKPTPPRLEKPKPEKAQEKTPQKYEPNRAEELKPETGETFQEPWPEKARERSPHKYTPKLEGPKPEKAQERVPQGYTPRKLGEHKPEEEIPFKFRIRRGKENLKMEDDGRGLKSLGPQEPTKEFRPEKGQHEGTKPKSTTIKSQRKHNDETEQRPTLKAAANKPKDEKLEKGAGEIEKEKESKRGELEGNLPEKPEKMFQEKEIGTRKRIAETAEKGKESFCRKEDIVSTIGKGMRDVSASTAEVVTKISEGTWKEEEKPMLVNMGAAILVIAALGVYVSYKITSSGTSS